MTNLKLESTSFGNGEEIPKKFGYKQENINPSLAIKNLPENTESWAIIMDDPDAMDAVGKIWIHWLIWNISPNICEITEGNIPQNTVQGKTDFGDTGYGGPAPPDKRHTYIFKVYALDTMLKLPESSTKQELENAMRNHIIEESKLTGTFTP